MHQAAIEVVHPVDLPRRHKARHGARRQHRVHHAAAREPPGRRRLDLRRDALEPHRKVLDEDAVELLGQQALEGVTGVQLPGQPPHSLHAGHERVGEHPRLGRAHPHVGEALDRGRGGVGGEECPVDGADAGSDHQVRSSAGSEQSIPTSLAPRMPPPPGTKATGPDFVVTRRD